MIKEIIMQGSYGRFQPTEKFQKYVENLGYSWWNG